MAKFDVFIEGAKMDLAVGAGFDLELRNSMFDFEAPAGSFAVGISLSGDSARNRMVLGNPMNPKVIGGSRLYYCEIAEYGNLVEKGYVKLKDGRGDFQFDFVSNLREFFGQYQSKILSSIDFGVIGLPSSWGAVTGYSWNSGFYSMPTIVNSVFYDKSIPGTYNGKVNDYVGGAYTASTKVPMFFLKNILSRIGVLSGVTFAGDFWGSGLLEHILIENTKSLDGESAIEIRKHLPDLTVAGLILGLRKTYNLNLLFDVKRKVLRMDFAKDVLKGQCTIDWTKYMPKIKTGTPVNTAGVELMWTVDGSEGLGKDSFFDSYVSPTNEVEGGRLRVQSEFCSLKMVAGALTTATVGVSNVGNNLDKKFGARLIYHTGGATASNIYGGVALKWAGSDGMVNNYWKEEERFRSSSFLIEENGGLDAYEVARMGAILRGESDEKPIVHIDGVNYLVEKVGVPSDKTKTALVRAWRLLY